ncbi:MAG: cytochrome c biogenesis protein CcdA [Chthonomonadales bacterium]
MIKRFRLIVVFAMMCVALPVLAQKPSKVKWTATLVPADARAGEHAQVVLTATIEPKWHFYSLTTPADASIPTTIKISDGVKAFKTDGKPVQPDPTIHHDDSAKVDLQWYSGAVAFGVPVTIPAGLKGDQKGTIEVRTQTCDDHICLPPDTSKVVVTFKIAPGVARSDHMKPVTTVPKQPVGYMKPSPFVKSGSQTAATVLGAPRPPTTADPTTTGKQIEEARKSGLLSYLWLSILAGFAALLTPCVFPMIPITVSYFAKRKTDTGGKVMAGPIAYCVGIVGTFVAVGLFIAIVFGATKLQSFAAHPYTNLALGALFTILAINLFGVFEIGLPPALVNKAHAGSRSGGLVGPLLMGLTFTLTSFTCTVPFVGTLLVAATQGDYLYPIIGMLGFGSAFALPFFLLALFPQYLARLPKSGSWLVSVKAFMGFLELAAALKFFSNADLSYQWGLITRPVFLAIWAGLSIIASFYLLGWLRLPHDEAGIKIGIPRRSLGVVMSLVGLYFLGAMNGAHLNSLEAFPPPDPYPGRHNPNAAIAWLSDYDAALAKGKAENKPVFVNFTGVTCVNCREMEKNVLPQSEVVAELSKFIPVELYTDRPNPGDEKNQQLLLKLANTTANPVYAVVSPQGVLIKRIEGRTDSATFAGFLKSAFAEANRTARN